MIARSAATTCGRRPADDGTRSSLVSVPRWGVVILYIVYTLYMIVVEEQYMRVFERFAMIRLYTLYHTLSAALRVYVVVYVYTRTHTHPHTHHQEVGGTGRRTLCWWGWTPRPPLAERDHTHSRWRHHDATRH